LKSISSCETPPHEEMTLLAIVVIVLAIYKSCFKSISSCETLLYEEIILLLSIVIFVLAVSLFCLFKL
jgi:uncharacterized membrane protein YidH (DUF202 family)